MNKLKMMGNLLERTGGGRGDYNFPDHFSIARNLRPAILAAMKRHGLSLGWEIYTDASERGDWDMSIEDGGWAVDHLGMHSLSYWKGPATIHMDKPWEGEQAAVKVADLKKAVKEAFEKAGGAVFEHVVVKKVTVRKTRAGYDAVVTLDKVGWQDFYDDALTYDAAKKKAAAKGLRT